MFPEALPLPMPFCCSQRRFPPTTRIVFISTKQRVEHFEVETYETHDGRRIQTAYL